MVVSVVGYTCWVLVNLNPRDSDLVNITEVYAGAWTMPSSSPFPPSLSTSLFWYIKLNPYPKRIY